MGPPKTIKPSVGQPEKPSEKTSSVFHDNRQELPVSSMRAIVPEEQQEKPPRNAPKASSVDIMKEILARSSGQGLLASFSRADEQRTVTSPAGSSAKETQKVGSAPQKPTSEPKPKTLDLPIASTTPKNQKKPIASRAPPRSAGTTSQIDSDEKLERQRAAAKLKDQKSHFASSPASSAAAPTKGNVKATAKIPATSLEKKTVSPQKQPDKNTLKNREKPLTGNPAVSTEAPKIKGTTSRIVSEKSNSPDTSRMVRTQPQPLKREKVSSIKSSATTMDGNPSTQMADKRPASPKQTASLAETKGWKQVYAFQYNSELYVSMCQFALPGSFDEPDQDSNKLPQNGSCVDSSFQEPRQTNPDVRVPERWEPDSDEPQVWIRRSLQHSVTLESYQWSEVQWAHLWCMAKHWKAEISDILGIQIEQFQSRTALAQMNYDIVYPGHPGDVCEQNWCNPCRQLLPEPRKAKRSKQRDSLRARLHADAETAIKMSNNWHYRTKRPGELGSEKEIIYDTQWDPECRIDTIFWTAENSARFIHDENLKYWDSRTEYGCWGHTGYPTVIQNSLRWDCCHRAIEAAGCHAGPGHEYHDTVLYDKTWRLHETPKQKPVDYRNAVVIDCQMGKNDWGQDELIKLTAIDYFSGEILIDKLVWPSVRLLHTDRWFTGIEWAELQSAHRDQTAIEGRDAARELLFRYVGDKTVLILFDGRRDMLALRLIHHHIIDAKHIGKENPRVDIDTMAHFYLRGDAPLRNIYRNPLRNSLQDAITTRNLVRQISLNEGVAEVYGPNFGLMDYVERQEVVPGNLTKLDKCHWPKFSSLMSSERQISRLRPLSTQRVPYLRKHRGHKVVPNVPIWRDKGGNLFDQNGASISKPSPHGFEEDLHWVYNFFFEDTLPEVRDFLTFTELNRKD
ncbi:hypothetical protein N7541_006990 [Penicillium brevicompactum]|uniref:Uncharacterized protein n=1 Tax=Penicillium brevicompactum TaxID=5074 RepID=A0A9W9QWA7_PENBR|nr:hypothetical protein N7541_006990 [Penicillium brevicompactum]